MASVRFTRNFSANLEAAQGFLQVHEADAVFERLLDVLEQTVIPNLEQFPLMGRLYPMRKSSVEGFRRISRIQERFGETDIREYLTGDYLLLYIVKHDQVYLLCIRHHRQVFFDLGAL